MLLTNSGLVIFFLKVYFFIKIRCFGIPKMFRKNIFKITCLIKPLTTINASYDNAILFKLDQLANNYVIMKKHTLHQYANQVIFVKT